MRKILYIAFLISSNYIFAQQNEVTIYGKVVDENNNPVSFADIAFRRKQLGFSSGKDGSFVTKMLPSDSLVVVKKGHTATKISIKDSISKNEYYITVILPRTPYELTEVQINAIRTYQTIRKEINKLYIKSTDMHPDARPMTNPLSYIYEQFSKHEKEKRIASRLETEEAKRIVLKDLLRLYNNYNIIELDEDEYDRFITYLNMPYSYLQQTSDYDLAVSIKRMYASYEKDQSSSFRKQIYPAALDDKEFIKQNKDEDR